METDEETTGGRRMRATYARVLALEVVVLVVLWAVGRYFGAV